MEFTIILISLVIFIITLYSERCLSCISSVCSVECAQMCEGIIPKDYKIHKPPNNNGTVTNVYTWFQVIDIGEINEEKMDYLLHMFIIYVWNDTRLMVDTLRNKDKATILFHGCLNYLWKPDIFYENAKDIKTFDKDSTSTLLKILPDGAVYLSIKYLFKASCPMNLEDYPFDAQKCKFLASLQSPDSVAKLKWIGDPDSPYRESFESAEILREPELLLFFISKLTPITITEQFSEGNYTSLIAEFTLVRRLIANIINTYMPSTMIVAMSWVGFWLQTDAVPARVALSVTSLLTLCTQVHQYRQQLPEVSYIKAMDIWLFICIFMVFSTLVEFAISYNSASKKIDLFSTNVITYEKKEENEQRPESKERKEKCWISEKETHSDENCCSQLKRSPDKILKKSLRNACSFPDYCSRYLFPVTFSAFAIIYWCYYLSIYRNSFEIL